VVLRKLGLENRFLKKSRTTKSSTKCFIATKKSPTQCKKIVLNRKVAQSICTTISSKLIMFLGPFASVKLVMQEVISSPLVVSNAFKL
jgi:hypothetical protein